MRSAKECTERSNGCGKPGTQMASHKKGDEKDMNNFRGVLLLLIMSRNLARILATRLRNGQKLLEH